jgi:hypothetical protein
MQDRLASKMLMPDMELRRLVAHGTAFRRYECQC